MNSIRDIMMYTYIIQSKKMKLLILTQKIDKNDDKSLCNVVNNTVVFKGFLKKGVANSA